jgi:hypothetical protein
MEGFMARFVRRGVLICVVALFAVSGCAEKEPTAAEAGETLKLHITELMKQSRALDVKITDSGGQDISCGEGRAKQTFTATGRHAAPNLSADALNSLLLGALSPVADYEIVEDPGKAPIHLANSTYRTTIILESPGDGRYRVRGETECLPTS